MSILHKLLASVLLGVLFQGVATLEDAEFWMQYGQDRLKEALNRELNVGRARNIIIFIGDGMGISTVTAARIYQGQRQGNQGEEHSMSFEKFASLGLAKTYNVDKQVPDSAATATAILTGVKVKFNVVGLDATASSTICDPIDDPDRRLPGLATWAQASNKSTGFVTTTRLTHATPATVYAHANLRHWECDHKIPTAQRDCVKDIARQLVEHAPGNKLKVILAGGQKPMGVTDVPDEDNTCSRTDGRNLVDEWLKHHEKHNPVYVNTSSTLMDVDIDKVDHILGLFSPGHFPFVSERGPEHPSLVNMTAQAIRLLNKNKNGFFLLVEGGRIDQAHHQNLARKAMEETAEFDEAVAKALELTDPKDTLIIVTADHSHAFTMNGYPNRGNDILGFANRPFSPANATEYETLTYANGPGYGVHRAGNDTNATWLPLAEMNRTESRYRHMAGMELPEETHGGEDVAVFANGPFAHLLDGVFEQNYIAHVAAYAGCIGPSVLVCGREEEEVEEEGNGVVFFCVSTISIMIVISLSIYLSKRCSRKKGGEMRL